MPLLSRDHPMARVLGLRDFRLLFAGAAASLLGDQFAIIAMPWLVLKMTQDPLALGVVLALQGVPRAVFLLLGGAITDRLTPRRVMLIANSTRFLLIGAMALLVLTELVQLWMIYVFGLLFGILAGFAIPAENSIVPMLVEERDLQAGNSLIMGVTQLANFIGPTLAGILIGVFSDSNTGMGLAFAINSGAYVISAVMLQLIRTGKEGPETAQKHFMESILGGIHFVWRNGTFRLMVVLLAVVNFLMVGPILVGIPVLANTRLPEGATAFGLLMSGYAAGNLSGYGIAGSLRQPSGAKLRWIMIAFVAVFGLVLGSLGLLSSTWIDMSLSFILGLGNGYLAIILFTWIQVRTPPEMLGRMMSVLLLANMGTNPFSQALAGLLIRWDLTILFILAGALVLLLAAAMALIPQLKDLTQEVRVTAIED